MGIGYSSSPAPSAAYTSKTSAAVVASAPSQSQQQQQPHQSNHSTIDTGVASNHGKASMLYAALGDAIGYKKGDWEFNKSTTEIMKQANQLGGIHAIKVNVKDWPVSDDTVMHAATAMALLESFHPSADVRREITLLSQAVRPDFVIQMMQCGVIVAGANQKLTADFYKTNAVGARGLKRFPSAIMHWYTACMNAMDGRAPGRQTLLAVDKYLSKGMLPDRFSASAGGNGASMRTMCIGLMKNISPTILVHLSMISGIATHPNFVAMVGGCMSAAFTHLAAKGDAPQTWIYTFYTTYWPLVEFWIGANFYENDVTLVRDDPELNYFSDAFYKYAQLRFDKSGTPIYPKDWLENHAERDAFYKQFAYKSADGSTWNGSSGHDSVLIAYDCFLYSPGDWHTVAYLAALHGGDSDSTASIAGAFFGALNGMRTDTMVGLEFASPLAAFGVALPKVIVK